MVQHKGGRSKAGSPALEGSPPFEKREKFSRKRVEKKMVNVHVRAPGAIYIFSYFWKIFPFKISPENTRNSPGIKNSCKTARSC